MKKVLNSKELAQRWSVSERTLERWRCEGKGPRYIKISGCVRYLISDIENMEQLRCIKPPIGS
ncbi:MAG: helix-turn-helix transcriptional regulator [Endozoicomonas sp.]